MDIRVDDLTHPAVLDLIRFHLEGTSSVSPPESTHALGVEALRQPQITVWTAWIDGDLAGCGALKETGPTHGEVKSMRTAPSHLRQGVAAALLRRILAEAELRGYRQVSLETGAMAAFEPARRLYARFGFAACGPFGDYRPDPNSVFMTRHVGDSPSAAESGETTTGQVVLETDRLVLRHQTADDAPFILQLLNDPDWLTHIGDRGVRTTAQARAYVLDGAVAMYERYGFGLYLVETKRDRVPVGICGLVRRDSLDDVDIGFALASEHRGRGYAREAAAATVAYARAEIGLDQLAAIVSTRNDASVRLLQELAFAFDRELDLPGDVRVHLYKRPLS